MKKLYTGFLVCLITPLFAQPNLQELDAELHSIMVYNASAELNYTKELTVNKGKNTIVFTNLTPYIVENTVNVTMPDTDVELVNVSETINHIRALKANNKKITSLRDSVNRLQAESALLKCREDAYNKEKELLFKNEAIGGVSQGVAVAEIEKAADFFSERYYQLNKKLYYLELEQKSIRDRMTRYSRQIEMLGTNTNEPGSEIELTLISPSKKTIRIDFKFLTAKGGWAPMYDCKYQGPDKPIKFVFRANVFNSSGTAWNNVNVKLSTASPTRGFDAPSINNTAGRTVAANDGKVQFKTIQVSNAIATYNIKHKQTIPSDSKPYLMSVDEYEMEASFHYLLIPKLDPFGFLMAQVPDWNKYNLIPGATNVYNEGSYMGKTFLNTYAENDTLSLYLGKDGKVQTSKKEVTKTNKNKILGNYYVETSEILITIDNKSNANLPIKILDQVPVFSAKGNVKFNLQGISEAFYDEPEGLLAWEFNLPPNAHKEIAYSFEIKEPKEEWIRSGRKAYATMRRFRTISCPSF